jgi:hypothetical protein
MRRALLLLLTLTACAPDNPCDECAPPRLCSPTIGECVCPADAPTDCGDLGCWPMAIDCAQVGHCPPDLACRGCAEWEVANCCAGDMLCCARETPIACREGLCAHDASMCALGACGGPMGYCP